jgi:Kef-type K+ transport system membrane component KefB
MLKLLQAHGLDAGPMQRPLLAGALGGVIATVPALAVLVAFQSLNEPARAAGTSVEFAGGAYVGLMLLGGVLYGWLFQRAANDPWGGWLFGLAFGFVVWMLGPIPLLQWLPDEPILHGYPAAGLLLAQLLWGLTLGVVFPPIHRRLHAGMDVQAGSGTGITGPEAAARAQPLRPLPSSRRLLS